MKEELKTLKDIDFSKLEFREKRASEYLIENLKAEAVKWVKKFDKEINSTQSTKKIDRLVYGLEFLKHFFNLTEEDLK